MVTAILGLGLGIAKAAGGFTQSVKAKRAARQAELDAAKLFGDARRRANVNVYEELSVPFDAYERGFEANLQADMQALSALQDADSRALIGGVGRIGAQQEAQAEQMRIAMADEMFNLDKLKADAKENIKQQNIAMDIAEARRKDQERREALQMRQQGLQQGIAGLGESMVAASGFFPEGMKKTLGTDQEPPVDIVGNADITMPDVGMAPSLKTAPLSTLGTPVQPITAPEKFTQPLTSGSVFAPTLGTAGLTMFPGVTALQPPPMYNQAITGPGRIYDRRGRVVDFFNK